MPLVRGPNPDSDGGESLQKLWAVLKESGRRENCCTQHLFPVAHHVVAAGAEASQWNQLPRRQIADHKA